MAKPLRWIRVLWALPASLLGLGLGLLAWAGRRGTLWQTRDGVVEAAGEGVGALLNRLGGSRLRIEALTLGHVVLARDAACLQRWRAHERVHVRQYERWGPGFLPAYALASLWAWARGGCPYRDNAFERAAFDAERQGPAPSPALQEGKSRASMP